MTTEQIRQAALEIAEEAIRRARSGSWTLDDHLSELDRLDITAELERIAEEVATRG